MLKAHRNCSGQTLVEYAIVLVFFTTVAVAAYRSFPQSLGTLYNRLSDRRTGIVGMMP
jgi:Flp pilus assembly pilin Flp